MPNANRPMFRAALVLALLAMLSSGWTSQVHAAKRTVCTITVNSDDERNAFRKYLPPDDYEFVELVERGRPDWLASACSKGIRCDMLVISGHFNGSDFFSDQVDVGEYLPVAEIERASCSESCPALMSQLKEVYLFGCDTLNGESVRSASADMLRSMVGSGRSPSEPELRMQGLAARSGESNRDVMRRVFVDVPAIYGFSSVAPLGSTAGPILSRYLQAAPRGAVGGGRPNRRLLDTFATHSMTVAAGLTRTDARAAHRAEVCRFVDDRTSAAQKLDFVHGLLRRDMAEMRPFFDRIERLLAALPESVRQSSAFTTALDRIARDDATRARFLAFARDADSAASRIRMIDVARTLGWLSAEEQRSERVQALLDLLARPAMTAADVGLACAMNRDRGYDAELVRFRQAASNGGTAGHVAALACLGSPDEHARMLLALASSNERDLGMAEVYIHHRPIRVASELRNLAAGIVRMTRPEAQVRALNALARQSLVDEESLAELMRLFASAELVNVQRAVAGVFLRSDHGAIATPALVRALREHRLSTSGPVDIIDALIRRLERAVTVAEVGVRR